MWGEIKLIKAVEIWYLGHVCYIIEWLPNRIIIYLVANWSTVVMKGSYGQEPVPKAKTLFLAVCWCLGTGGSIICDNIWRGTRGYDYV
jgi:hypothetical protein